MRAPILLCAGVLVLSLLGGCPPPGCPNMPLGDASQALRLHRSLRRTVRALKAEARVDQRGPEGRIRGTVLLLLERPDRVRFDAMTQLGPAATLTSDGERFQLLDQREGRFLEGPSCPENLGRLLGITLEGEELARFLVGDTPRLPDPDPVMSCTEEGYRITLEAEGQRQEIVLRPRSADRDAEPLGQHLRLVRSELFRADGSTDWRASFDDYRLVRDPTDPEGRGVALPFVVRFVDPDLGADTLVRVRDLELLERVPDETAFAQPAPPGVPRETAACTGP
ncbi:MAG: DUF4292 domain-containing protein [Myxococcota bacterium]